eukprot:97749-Amphidinium_carterae.1
MLGNSMLRMVPVPFLKLSLHPKTLLGLSSNDRLSSNDIYKDDREIVFAAVIQDGSALEWASERMKSDPEIVQLWSKLQKSKAQKSDQPYLTAATAATTATTAAAAAR